MAGFGFFSHMKYDTNPNHARCCKENSHKIHTFAACLITPKWEIYDIDTLTFLQTNKNGEVDQKIENQNDEKYLKW